MSDEPMSVLQELTAEPTGGLYLDLSTLPPGSLVTVTIRIGPETPPAPEPPAPEATKPRRYVGGP